MDDSNDQKTTDIQPADLQPTDLVNLEDEPQAVSAEAEQEQESMGAVSQLMSLESTIKNYIKSIASLRAELREKNAALEDACNNDSRYFQEEEKVKEAARKKADVRDTILKQPGLISVTNEIKEIRLKLKEQAETLEKYLKQFEEIAKTNQIVTDDGETHEIVVKRALKKKSSKYNP
jgi:phage/plasmid-associated DNA primase